MTAPQGSPMEMLEEARRFLAARLPAPPEAMVVLGSGLGGFARMVGQPVEIPYREIPHWAPSTAVGHAGKLVAGRLGEVRVAVMQGRLHLYEGYSPSQVVFGLRVLGLLGARVAVLTNAAGGIWERLRPGDLALIRDHINLLGVNPLAGPNLDALGARHTDMTEAYSGRLRRLAREVANGLSLRLPEAVYAAVPGPSYETPAEIRYLRTVGADLVGMSTVPETIAARHMGLEVVGISCVTNLAAGLGGTPLTHDEVLEVGRQAEASLCSLLSGMIGDGRILGKPADV